MSFEGEKLLTSNSVPNLAGSVIGASDELAATLVESTVGEGKEMGFASLEVSESLFKVLLLLFNQLLDQLLERRFARLGD